SLTSQGSQSESRSETSQSNGRKAPLTIFARSDRHKLLKDSWREKQMSDEPDLESRVVAAIRHYRAALDVAENLEREDACAHRALTSTLLDLERALRGEAAPHLNNNLFETGSTAVARSDKTWADLVEATARLDSARRTLAALERQLGYLPKVSRGADHK
ncbi:MULTISPECIES: hypothetical protein, partial [Bradyrhizobium]